MPTPNEQPTIPAVSAVPSDRSNRWERPVAVATRASAAVVAAAASTWFLVAVVFVFVVGSALMAVMQNYPTVYDEDYHVGIIRIYAGQVSPLIENGSQHLGLGDLDRFGSFLYHWLMSFPLRAVDGLGFSLFTQVAVLRLLSVLLFASSVIWTRKVLDLLGVSRLVSNVAISLFLALPLTSAIASTVNYDNLLQPLAAVFFLFLVRAYTADRVVAGQWWAVLVFGALSSITKFTFLPVFGLAVVLLLVRHFVWRGGRTLSGAWRSIEWPRRRSVLVWSSVVGGLVVAGLFAERYLGNVLSYGTPSPDCGEIHSEAYCSTYSVWERNERLEAGREPDPLSPSRALVFFSTVWIREMVTRLSFFGSTTANGREFSLGPVIVQQLIVLGACVVLFLAALVVARLAVRRDWQPLVVTAAFFTLVLFVRNYTEFSRFGEPIATQPRYFYIYIPILIAAAGLVLGRVIDGFYGRAAVVVRAAVVLLMLASLTQGGFASSFFAFATENWINWGSPASPLFDDIARIALFVIV